MRYRFVQEHRTTWPIGVQCRVLEVSRSGYYAWLGRPESCSALDYRTPAEVHDAPSAGNREEGRGSLGERGLVSPKTKTPCGAAAPPITTNH